MMPELPEIEHLRRTLEPAVIGAVVQAVRVHRPDVIRQADGSPRRARQQTRPLLRDQRIESVRRHGKQLALVADSGRVVSIHLGMSGQLVHRPTGKRLTRTDHVHCEWQLLNGVRSRLAFRDPRRFGGIWCFESIDQLRLSRWAALGPDALAITPTELAPRLAGRLRGIKAVLLDQTIIAGIGNIYADEILFRSQIYPLQPAATLDHRAVDLLCQQTRAVLTAAIDAGGSTIRDYVDANNAGGSFAAKHLVYGRSGEPCVRCDELLVSDTIAGRTTVWCTACQPLR